jgi:hypothetical protein
MINSVKDKIEEKVKHSDKSWDTYIHEAQRQLSALEERKKGLLTVISTFKHYRDSGEPWPGNIAGTNRESIPA